MGDNENNVEKEFLAADELIQYRKKLRPGMSYEDIIAYGNKFDKKEKEKELIDDSDGENV